MPLLIKKGKGNFFFSQDIFQDFQHDYSALRIISASF